MKKILIIILAALHIPLDIDIKTVQADRQTPSLIAAETNILDQGSPEPSRPEPRPAGQDSAGQRPPETTEPVKKSIEPMPRNQQAPGAPRGFKVVAPK